MKPYYQDVSTTILHGDCIEAMRTMPDNSVDSIVTDPPYGLGFMGKKWDSLPPGEEWAQECLRVLKPGGHLIAFGGSRTWHRLAVAIEDAGFEIRDGVLWLYGSGFPKSHDISKAIDKMAGATPIRTGDFKRASIQRNGAGDNWSKGAFGSHPEETKRVEITAPATPEARQWEGWGTALKPAYEPAVMARKPFKGTVARNVLEHGTGAININASRIQGAVLDSERRTSAAGASAFWGLAEHGGGGERHNPAGRFPANLILDEHTAAWVDEQSGITQSPSTVTRGGNRQEAYGMGRQESVPAPGDKGGASRFFYVAKAPKSERPVVDGIAHPTVKPLALMRWLCKLVTPTGGTILDPFAGSGTTIEAATLEGFNSIGIERETDYLPLIQHRINRANGEKP